MHRFHAFLFCLLFAILFNCAYGQPRIQNEIGFKNDNDVYLMKSKDEYYTNGIGFFYKRAIDSVIFSQEKWKNKLWSIGVGHKIYNAYTGDIGSEDDIDRPITGYLYLSGDVNWYTKREEAMGVGLEIGVIGKKAFGEDVQRGFHQLFGFYEIDGWQYQLNNAIGIDARANYSRLLFRNSAKRFDIFMASTASIGLNNTRLSLSPIIRLGKINSLFESSIMGSRLQSGKNKPDKELYFFYRPQFNWVAYNSTIQGGALATHKRLKDFDIKPFVFSQVIGFQMTNDRIGLGASYIHTTREVVNQLSTHEYGSISVTCFF